MKSAFKQYGPTFLADQNSPAAQQKFLTALQEKYQGLISNDNVMQFALKYGFALENAFRAIQQGIDSGIVDAQRFDNNVLYITHRQEFLKGLPRKEVSELGKIIDSEIERLSQVYESQLPESHQEAKPTLTPSKTQLSPQSGIRKIRRRIRP